MNTLVIHPKDPSTDMLELVYRNIKNCTVVRDGSIAEDELMNLISNHDRIIMLGHGTASGLLNSKWNGFIINDNYADLLKTKETFSIWCNSDGYFRRHNMKGFHTGMIISEVYEAQYVLGKMPLNKEETLENITYFCKLAGDVIDKTPEEIRDYMLEHYNFSDEQTQFNRNNLIIL